ncbi:MAG: spore germination protein [Clostridia bacterium]|nr:spore germination protein [Clostridia bacterium]
MNKFFRKIAFYFRFDNSATNNFELLETEFGEPSKSADEDSGKQYNPKDDTADTLFYEADKNIDRIKTAFRTDISKDLVVRDFMLCGRIHATLAFINGMADNEIVNNYILRDGMNGEIPEGTEDLCKYAVEHIFTVNDMSIACDYDTVRKALPDGKTIIFIDGDPHCCIADTRKFPQRSVEAAENEKGVLGPREAFIENIRTNISLIRRHVHTDDLVCEMRPMGEETSTAVGILYRDKVASESLVNEVKRKLATIKTGSVLSTGIINQMAEPKPFSPIPQTLLTEKPDRCASYLLDGHVVILCDGSPLAAILPVTLFSLMSTPEDSYSRQVTGTVLRIIRYIGALISIILPGIFIAIVMYHHGFLSSEMLSTLITSRKMVFIPIGIELLLLLFVFQLVREAGMRVPGTVGQAIGIIGGLVLGQAVVSANLASSVVLILVALTGLGTFCIPDYSTQISSVYLRIIFMIAGWMGGFLGLGCAWLIFTAYICTLKSFGVPFLTPYAPKSKSKRMNVLRGPINNKTHKEDYMQ